MGLVVRGNYVIITKRKLCNNHICHIEFGIWDLGCAMGFGIWRSQELGRYFSHHLGWQCKPQVGDETI